MSGPSDGRDPAGLSVPFGLFVVQGYAQLILRSVLHLHYLKRLYFTHSVLGHILSTSLDVITQFYYKERFFSLDS